MGFFSDLKEDLSQAVNELMPMEVDKVPKEESMRALPEDMVPLPVAEATPVASEPAEAVENTAEETVAEITADVGTEQVAEDNKTEANMNSATETAEQVVTESAMQPIADEQISATVVVAEVTEQGDATENVESADVPESKTEVKTGIKEKIKAVIKSRELAESKNETEAKAVEKTSVAEEVAAENVVAEAAKQETASPDYGIVSEGMHVLGDIISDRHLDVRGTVEGSVEIQGTLYMSGCINGMTKAANISASGARFNGDVECQGIVEIGSNCVVLGNVVAQGGATIAGAVKGDIDVHGPVVLEAGAIVKGDIKSESVQINNGAIIEGMCSQCYAQVNVNSFFENL